VGFFCYAFDMKNNKILHKTTIQTPLGKMQIAGDDQFLYALEFVGDRSSRSVKKLEALGFQLVAGSSKTVEQIKKELQLYFAGELKTFKTPVSFWGTEFQKNAWQSLQKIPYGETRSYLDQAVVVGNAKAFRAVANANGKNHLAIIIPCHRIINKNGKLGGYGGGLVNKQWLLNHERKMK
jgi:O-6-methylguanine DNA methyltransferase